MREQKHAGRSDAFISEEENDDNSGVDGCDDGERGKRRDFE